MSFKLKISRVLAMIVFLVSLFDSFSFSTFAWDCSIDLLVRFIRSVFHSITWIVFQDLSCYVFLLRRIKKCFALPHFAAFSTFCVKFF